MSVCVCNCVHLTETNEHIVAAKQQKCPPPLLRQLYPRDTTPKLKERPAQPRDII